MSKGKMFEELKICQPKKKGRETIFAAAYVSSDFFNRKVLSPEMCPSKTLEYFLSNDKLIVNFFCDFSNGA